MGCPRPNLLASRDNVHATWSQRKCVLSDIAWACELHPIPSCKECRFPMRGGQTSCLEAGKSGHYLEPFIILKYLAHLKSIQAEGREQLSFLPNDRPSGFQILYTLKTWMPDHGSTNELGMSGVSTRKIPQVVPVCSPSIPIPLTK